MKRNIIQHKQFFLNPPAQAIIHLDLFHSHYKIWVQASFYFSI